MTHIHWYPRRSTRHKWTGTERQGEGHRWGLVRVTDDVEALRVERDQRRRKETLTEVDLNRLAQRFYEASRIPLPSMTDKPKVVEGLRAVFEEIGVEIAPWVCDEYIAPYTCLNRDNPEPSWCAQCRKRG